MPWYSGQNGRHDTMMSGVLGLIPLKVYSFFLRVRVSLFVVLGLGLEKRVYLYAPRVAKLVTYHSLKLETVFYHLQYLLYIL